MLQISENYYDLNLIDILQELKYQLALQGTNLFAQIKEHSDDIMVSCPFHKGGQEKKPSCGIRKSDGFLHCFTCGETATLEQTISRCFGYSDLGQYGLNWLKNNFLGDIANSRKININFDRNLATNKLAFVKESELDTYRYYHPYMFKRKMTEEVISIFDIGFDKVSNCLTFPVKDIDGDTLFIARRSVTGKFFNYPSQIEKPVYGLYELSQYAPENLDEIYICESMINAITCWVYGKYAIALNGTGTEYQYEQIRKLPYRKLVLALDPDNAGRKGAIRLFRNLRNYKLITFLKGIPESKDINDLTKEEFDKLYQSNKL